MAQVSMATIAGLKETYVQLKSRMEKAVEDFRKATGGDAHRPRLGAHAGCR